MGITTLRRRYHGAPKVAVPDRPDARAKKDEWVAYATALGVDATGTKDEIIARLDAAPESGVTTAADLAPGATGDASSDETSTDDGSAASDEQSAAGE